MKSNCWKYPKKGELPELNTTVLCFTGGARFGQYELGSMVTDSTGEANWQMEYRSTEYENPIAWCNVPDVPEFI